MDIKNAIEIKNVSKSFKVRVNSNNKYKRSISFKIKAEKQEHVVLDDISFNVKKGEVIGILGRNGSGKSTLLKIISHILEPDSGTVEISGNIASILELGMGFHQDMSGRENIFIKGAMYGFSKEQIERKMDDIIEYSGLGEYIDSPLRTYSSGMTGRLAFAIMVNVDAEIFLVDEILSVGDASFSAKAAEHFKKAAKNGKTILLVSHSISSIEEMCSRAIWIENGRVKENGPVKTVCSHYKAGMTESFEITSDLAESGVANAQYRLALMYRDGTKIGVDESLAFQWMKSAAEQNHILAQLGYADMLFDGIGTEQDTVTAIQYYQMAADRGNNDARIKLATLIGDDDSERKETRELFRLLAERGNPLNEFRYADLILKTAWGESDRKEAFEWFKKAADDGNLDAKFQVGMMYRDGIGIKSDIESAVKMFIDIGEMGHQKAQTMLAEMYFAGTKVEKNEVESFRWYLKSAKSGNSRSQYQLGVMYRDGIGTQIDYDKAKYWLNIFSNSVLANYQNWAADILKNISLGDEKYSFQNIMMKAVKSENPNFMFKLASYMRDKSIDADADEIIRLFRDSADCNNVASQMALGDMFLKGILVEKDNKKAFEYYRRAALNGNSVAAFKVAIMYHKGIGIEADDGKYKLFLKIAQEGGYLDSLLNIV